MSPTTAQPLRMWASTIKTVPKWEKGYRLVDILRGKSAAAAVSCDTLPKSESSALAGVPLRYWEFAKGASGRFSLWRLEESSSDAAIAARRDIQTLEETGRLAEVWDRAKRRYLEDRRLGLVRIRSYDEGSVDG